MSRLTAMLVLTAGLCPGVGLAQGPSAGAPRVPMLSDEEAWKQLPPTEKGGGRPLPSWARALAGAIPKSTAALLGVDYAHRVRSSLDPKLRAEMRWVAAHANRCTYSEAYALADARRAGLDDAGVKELCGGDYSRKPAAEQAALEFARKMTVSSASVTDPEFAALVKHYGVKNAVAMVQWMAYSNFQDRLILSLGTALEPDGPLPRSTWCSGAG